MHLKVLFSYILVLIYIKGFALGDVKWLKSDST